MTNDKKPHPTEPEDRASNQPSGQPQPLTPTFNRVAGDYGALIDPTAEDIAQWVMDLYARVRSPRTPLPFLKDFTGPAPSAPSDDEAGK